MKILAINGSPRLGNIDFMLDILLESFKDKEIIKLRSKNIKFCGGGDNCCPVRHKCHIPDDMKEIYPKLEKADIIILASPSYFSNVTARMKNFMDRCNPYWFSKKLKGKYAFLLSAGGCIESKKPTMEVLDSFAKILELDVVDSYYAIADKLGEADNSKVIKELKNLSNKLKL